MRGRIKTRFFTFIWLSLCGISSFAQSLSSDYKMLDINRLVKDIACENPYASPVENYAARMYSWINGVYQPINSEMIDAEIRQTTMKPYSQKSAVIMLNSEIVKEVIYRDSVGFVFRRNADDTSAYFVGISVFENGKWLGNGEGLCFAKNMDETTQYIENNMIKHLLKLRQYYRLKTYSTDTLAFVNYLKNNGKEPLVYLNEKLKNHKVVIFGEVHYRKIYWDLLRQLIKTPEFSATTGTIFLELSKDAQPYLDTFYQNKTKDPSPIIKIFQQEELSGWNYRGMYDFLLDLWDVNRNLKNKIKVVATDYQREFYQKITSKQQHDSISRIRLDRNEIMAETIVNTINNSQDKRNSLFIVGCMHAYKSSALQIGSLLINGLSAGYLLSEKLGNDNVFSIFTHTANGLNNGAILGKIRNGLFDYAFAENGNKPAAFDLKHSPFGKEMFDYGDIRFDIKTGTFADNFDGYIFLQSLQDEVQDAPLYELYTDEFVEEIKRRFKIAGLEKETWFGVGNECLTKDVLVDYLNKN
ncbi:MAG: hypothetical protein LBR64_07005 [Dysgonamonadaceae bacterium]|jgi:uncharacterized iron-regulated protein|nr:hypothetical protein [Dysgonamonadaceae bacterium]